MNGGWLVERHPRFLADVNGDGKQDVVGFGDAGVYLSLSTGASFEPGRLSLPSLDIILVGVLSVTPASLPT